MTGADCAMELRALIYMHVYATWRSSDGWGRKAQRIGPCVRDKRQGVDGHKDELKEKEDPRKRANKCTMLAVTDIFWHKETVTVRRNELKRR